MHTEKPMNDAGHNTPNGNPGSCDVQGERIMTTTQIEAAIARHEAARNRGAVRVLTDSEIIAICDRVDAARNRAVDAHKERESVKALRQNDTPAQRKVRRAFKSGPSRDFGV